MKSIIVIYGVLGMFFFSCSNEKTGHAEDKKTETVKLSGDMVQLSAEQCKNSGVTVGTPEQREMHGTLKVNGVVDVPPDNVVSISIPLGGYLKRATLIPGQKVTKGSVLAIVEDQQYIQLQQDYLTGKSRLEQAEADFNRQKELNDTKSASDKIYQQAKAEFTAQKILVSSLAEKLRLIGLKPERLNEDNISRSINVYSPLNGYVTRVNVNNGQYVNPSDVLFELMNPADLHVSLTVFENDASNLYIGQKLVCSTNNRPDEKYIATIHLITPNIGEDRATEVHCHLEENHKKLFPGTFVNALIELNNTEVTAVPEEAVVKWENKYYLFSEEAENRFKLFPVETGVSNNGYVEIRSALPSKKIVTKNAYTVLMKMKNNAEEG